VEAGWPSRDGPARSWRGRLRVGSRDRSLPTSSDHVRRAWL